MNVVFINLDFKKTMVDTLLSLNRSYQRALDANKQLIGSYENQVNLRKLEIAEQDTIIRTYKKKNETLERTVKVLKVAEGSTLLVAVAFAIKIFVFH
jgi:hypothetical protein